MKVRYPQIKVQLVGEDGNCFMVLGRVARAMRAAKVPPYQIKEFMAEATSGDYDNLLGTCMRWVTCD
jgi:hypothetical protein